MGKCYQCEKLCNKKTAKHQSCRYRKVISHSDAANARYEEACNMLVQEFARKHGWEFEGWVGYFNPDTDIWNRYAGGLATFGDTVISLDDIRTDLMEDTPPEAYSKFEEETVDFLYKHSGTSVVSYYNWLHGARNKPEECSEIWKQAEKEKLEQCRITMKESKECFNNALDSFQ